MKSCHGVNRTRWLNSAGTVGMVLAVAAAMPGQAFADDASAISQEELRELAAALKLQQQRLAAQERALADQQRVIAEQQNQLNFLKTQVGSPLESPGTGSVVPVIYNLGQAGSPGSPRAGVFKAQDPAPQQQQPQQPVGQAPVEQRPEVSIIPERGGVLTRKGQLVLEPQIEYAQSNTNRFFFQGFEVVDTVLIGLIEATDAERETLQAALGARVGVTDRLEFEIRVPYLYRDDTVKDIAFVGGDPVETFPGVSATGDGLGDIEVAAHYQINDGLGGWPYFVGNLRIKTDTGTGPFDVDFNEDGIATELATGSGFWAIQPSVTTIFPTDPAVFFGNLGYTWNIERDVNETIETTGGTTRIGDVDPGDSVNTTFGMGVSLNERTSFSFGFEYNYVFETEQESNGVTAESDKLKIGSLLLGWSYQLTDDIGLNLNTAFGVTEDATDFRTTLRVPIRFDLF